MCALNVLFQLGFSNIRVTLVADTFLHCLMMDFKLRQTFAFVITDWTHFNVIQMNCFDVMAQII